MEAIKEDVKENKGKVASLYETIFGSEKGPGLQAKVENNSVFIKEVKFYVRASFLLVIGEIIAVVFIVITK